MKLIRRYLVTETLGATAFVFAALVSLFALFDLIRELKDFGQGSYRLPQIIGYVLLSVPGHVYELFPIAVLIGTIFALAQLAANSEYAVIRVSGVSVRRFAAMLAQVGLVLAAVNFLLGEFVAPASEQAAQRLRVRAKTGVVASDFRSGLWIREAHSFINVLQPLPDGTLAGVRIYQFDDDYRLLSISYAERGVYQEDERWLLRNVVRTVFDQGRTRVEHVDQSYWTSVLSPEILNVLLVDPEQRSARDLFAYVQHLRENRQQSARFELALWTKFTYPLAAVVMMVLALPFAHLHRRTGGIGGRIFVGIMLGLAFHLANRLTGYLGLIYEWPVALSALLPGALFLLLAFVMISLLERR
ncbi:MAG: LPS export ABC transporter permease LptG [Burkholderiales bacterium]|nr:LPS export ABC transporter permease LptG [Burkholderiales bacterium]